MFVAAIWWLAFICSLTLLGNVLVIAAVYRESSLHSATYYYIVSLAVADLCVGVIVIPLAILFELVLPSSSSSFGFLCHLWHISDVGASTASILALCVIALDRYLAITSPIRYPRSFLSRHSSLVIAMIWFCSAMIAGPTVIILGQTTRENKTNNLDSLRCQFPSSPVFILVSSSVSFYIPLLIMVFVYGRILVSARRQMIALRQGYKTTTGAEKKKTTTTTIENFNVPEPITLRIHRGKYSRSPSLPPLVVSRSRSRSRPSNHSSFPLLVLRRLRQIRRTRSWSQFSREHKATKVLGIIMGVFIACWLPFFVFLLLTGVFNIHLQPQREEQLFRLFTWLGYTNSAVSLSFSATTDQTTLSSS